MVTIKDISKKVGLSTATVIRALNGFDDVHEDTRIRVEKAARELGYFANRAAKLLVSGKSSLHPGRPQDDPRHSAVQYEPRNSDGDGARGE